MALSRSTKLTSLAVTLLAMATAGVCNAGKLEDRHITVASTTSTANSGLFDYLLPQFRQKTGIAVRVVALGTGQALDVARRGDADVVFVHDTAAEEQFVRDGFGIGRRDVMYNDFVLVGPRTDPVSVAGGRDAAAALRAISKVQAPFVSRGDRSGTHAAELRLWMDSGVDIASEKGAWYREAGAGMGAALNMASAMHAYVIADRSTWLAFKNRGDLAVLVEGDPRLFNPYGVTLVNPARHPHVNRDDAREFVEWLVSTEGQAAIAGFRIEGAQAFFPAAQGPWPGRTIIPGPSASSTAAKQRKAPTSQ